MIQLLTTLFILQKNINFATSNQVYSQDLNRVYRHVQTAGYGAKMPDYTSKWLYSAQLQLNASKLIEQHKCTVQIFSR